MQHVYYDLNTAWNAKEIVSDAVAESGSDEMFNLWGQFPTDLPLMRIKLMPAVESHRLSILQPITDN